MARMVPGSLPPGVKSGAEKTLYNWFQNDPKTKDWTVLYSLLLSESDRAIIGECDFVVVAPNIGIFPIEVKGGQVSFDQNLWVFTDKNGHVDKKKKSPFAQASSAMFCIKKYLGEQFHGQYSNRTMHHAVFFMDIVFDQKSPEWSPEEIFDSRNGTNLYSFFVNLSKYAKKRAMETKCIFFEDPSVQDAKRIVDLLRPSFERIPSLRTLAGQCQDEMIKLTNGELKSLDQMEANSRMIIHGPAGTGKTVLAIQAIMRANATNNAFMCYSKNLSVFLKKACALCTDKVSFVGTFHSLIVKNIIESGVKTAVSEEDLEINDEFLHLFKESIKIKPMSFSMLVVDEAQDLTNPICLEIMDMILDGGLAEGKWYFFADYDNQSIFHFDGTHINDLNDARQIISEYSMAEPPVFKLLDNCRNSLEICKWIEGVCGVTYKNTLEKSPSMIDVQTYTFSKQTEQLANLKKAIFNLVSKEIKKSQITILSPNSFELSAASGLENIQKYSVEGNDEVSFSTIQSFKGLENDFIILIDVEDYFPNDKEINLFYVGLSRARIGLTVFESMKAMGQRIEKMLR